MIVIEPGATNVVHVRLSEDADRAYVYGPDGACIRVSFRPRYDSWDEPSVLNVFPAEGTVRTDATGPMAQCSPGAVAFMTGDEV